ncbi:MAG: hypothetical protein WA057_05765 [Candidatus Magasanikiibacteriota bacterium]
MKKKNFLETAMLNQTGLWNGYAMVESKYSIEPKLESILRLMGFNINKSSGSRVKELFRRSHGDVYSTTLFEAPKAMSKILVVDKNLENNYGIIGINSLKTTKQCNISYSEESHIGLAREDFYRKLLNFHMWLLFNVKPSMKLEGRVFHSISVYLRYIDNHYEKNVPSFEFQVSVPKCFIEESNRNPEFIKEIRTKLGF